MNNFEITADGSHTIYNQEIDEHYHSINGALAESIHIFINAGFNYFCQHLNIKSINIFEVGFGTGLNTILTLIEAVKQNINVNYFTIEKYPINNEDAKKLNYFDFIEPEFKTYFNQIHEVEWNKMVKINSNFNLFKIENNLINFNFETVSTNNFDLIYFDAFSFEKQPELWSQLIFSNIYNHLNINGILLTYSAKGIIKQNLRAVGFEVKRLNGPKGKRHIIRALKH